MKNILFLTVLSLIANQNLNAQSGDKDAIISALQYENKELTRQVEELRMELSRMRNNGTASRGTMPEEYKVQLGIQNPDNLIGPLSQPRTLAADNVNGKAVYGIGGFTSPTEAYQLSQEMRKLNLAGSFVTRYVNGVRDMSYSYSGPGGQPGSPTSNNGQRTNYSKAEIEGNRAPAPNYSTTTTTSYGDNGGYNSGPVKVPGIPSKSLTIEE